MRATFLTALILPGLLLAAPIAGSEEPAAETAPRPRRKASPRADRRRRFRSRESRR